MLDKNVCRQNNKLYVSTGFYEATGYLERSRLVKRYQKKNDTKVYFDLTFKGQMLAEILASLDDTDPAIKARHGME